MIEIKDPSTSFKIFPGPILLLAGPGTGKTYQLAERVPFLINELAASPDEICIITFTAAAARQMRERLAKDGARLPVDKRPGAIITMHGLGNSIIARDLESLGLPEQYKVLTVREHRDLLLQDAGVLAGYHADEWKLTDDCRRKGACSETSASVKCRICAEYQGILRKCALVDYDDQIFLACRLLQSNKVIAEDVRAKSKYLLVDEYQDINQAQCEFIQLLTQGQTAGLFAVGDDDQSIYSFRGGDPKFIRDFGKCFGESSKIGRLYVSWRCPQHILLGSRKVVEKYFLGRQAKPIPTFSETLKTNNKITLYDMPSDNSEAEKVASIAEKTVKRMRSMTVLIPNRLYFPPLRRALIRHGLSFAYRADPREDGLLRFALLDDWVQSPQDNMLFRYLLQLVIENNDEIMKKLPLSANKITERRMEAREQVAGLWKKVSLSSSLHEAFVERATGKRSRKTVEQIIMRDCLDVISQSLSPDRRTKRKHLSDFLRISGLMVAPCKHPEGLLKEIDEWRSDRQGNNAMGPYLPVEIYNLPSSKGLQADVICVLGLSEDLFPRPDDDIEEKSRLLYVAMTRAKEELYLFSSRKRSGSITLGRSYSLKPSSMLATIPKENLDRVPIYPKRK